MSIRQWFERKFGGALVAPRFVSQGTYTSASRKLREEVRVAAEADGAAQRPGQADSSIALQEQQIVHLHSQISSNAAADMQLIDAQLLPRFLEARRDFMAAQRSYEEKRNEPGIDGRPILTEISLSLYLILIVAFMAGEVAMNYRAFQAMFADGDSTSMVSALAMGLAMLVISHYVGAFLRQNRMKLFAWGLVVLGVAMAAGLAYLRMQMVAADNVKADLFQGVNLNEFSVSLFFFLVNILFLVVSAGLSAMRHDPDVTYEKRHRAYLRARREVMDLKRLRDANRRQYLGEAMDDQGVCRRLLAEYREINMSRRDVKAMPRAWIDHPIEKLICTDERQFDLGEHSAIQIAGEPAGWTTAIESRMEGAR